jgi:hypothetical protein
VCYELAPEFADLYRAYGDARADGTRTADNSNAKQSARSLSNRTATNLITKAGSVESAPRKGRETSRQSMSASATVLTVAAST